MARRGRGDEDDEGDAPAKVLLHDIPRTPPHHPLSPDSSGHAVVRAVMASIMARDPDLAVNLREEFLAWIDADFLGDMPKALRRVAQVAIEEGLTRGEVTKALRDSTWLGPGSTLPLPAWRAMLAEAGREGKARALTVLEETPVGLIRRAELTADAFDAAVRDANTGHPELRDGARAALVSISQVLDKYEPMIIDRINDADLKVGPDPSSPADPGPGSNPIAALRELMWAGKKKRSEDAEYEKA